jgi:hypothetical protein
VYGAEDKIGIMKDNEVIAVRLSPCVRIFIESLLNAELTTTAPGDTGTTEKSPEIKQDLGANRPELKNPR